MSQPDQGTVHWNEQSIYKWDVAIRSHWRGTSLGFVFQSFNLVPYLAVYENISIGLSLSNNNSKVNQNIDALLYELNLSNRKDHVPSELSVGQQQRVALARALVKGPQIILADEPTGNLDPETGKEVMDILKKKHSEGTTVVMITHDPNNAKLAQRTIKIVDGKIAI